MNKSLLICVFLHCGIGSFTAVKDLSTVCVVTLDLCQPIGLVVVLGGTEGGVEEDEQQNQPIECHRFDSSSTIPATDSIPATQRPTEREEDS